MMSLLLFCILILGIVVVSLTNVLTAKDEQSDKVVKILIVDFRGAPIPDMKVDIKDGETNEQIKQLVADDNGVANMTGLESNKSYLFVPSSIYDDGTDHSKGIAQLVEVQDSTNYIKLETYYVRDQKGANVPVVLQNPLYPHGCEITSLTAVLNYYGMDVSKKIMVDQYLPKDDLVRSNGQWIGPDPAVKYAGDPADIENGMYAFAPVIEKAANSYIKKEQSKLKVKNMTGATKEQILEKVKQGIPVITWVTLDLTAPKMKDGWTIKGTDREIEMYRNLHVVVVTGYQNGQMIVMDPLKGYVAHDEDKFFKSFKEMKSQAIVLEK